MRHALAALLLLAACGDNVAPPPVARELACAEQAEAWCERAGYPSGGCARVYEVTWCGPGEDVELEDHLACLEAIDANPHPGCVPDACWASWD